MNERLCLLKEKAEKAINDALSQIFKTIVKTHKTEVIPLNQLAQAILAKYEHLGITPLPKLSSQKLNDHIKDCCEEAEINTRVHYVDYSGGKAREHSEPNVNSKGYLQTVYLL